MAMPKQDSSANRAMPRIVEGVTIGIVVAAVLAATNWLVDQAHRQEEIAYVREMVEAARSDVSRAMLADAKGDYVPVLGRRADDRKHTRSIVWDRFVARLSNVLRHRTSRLDYDERMELGRTFPGVAVDGSVVVEGRPSSYKAAFAEAETIGWLALPSGAHLTFAEDEEAAVQAEAEAEAEWRDSNDQN